MSTTIQNNQPIQIIGSTEDLTAKNNHPENSVSESEWLAADIGNATVNNRLAQQKMIETEQTVPKFLDFSSFGRPFSENGDLYAFTGVIEEDNGIRVSTTLDVGFNETGGVISSVFDENGNLRQHAVINFDAEGGAHGEVHKYNENGDLIQHTMGTDTDADGVVDYTVDTHDADGNGRLDSQTIEILDAPGRIISRTEAKDINEDGLMDYAITQNFDEDGNLTSFSSEVYEGGLFDGTPGLTSKAQPSMPDATQVNPNQNGPLVEESIGPVSVDISRNEHGGLNVTTTVDLDGDGELEGFFSSQLDENGTLRVSEKREDHNGDGSLDNTEYSVFDADGNVVSHASTSDHDGNGVVDSARYISTDENNVLTHKTQFFDNETGVLGYQEVKKHDNENNIHSVNISEDKDFDGVVEKEVTTVFSGNTSSVTESYDTNQDGFADDIFIKNSDAEGSNSQRLLDSNSDGIVDIIEEETFDKDGNQTSYNITYTDDGIFEGKPPEPPELPEADPGFWLDKNNSLTASAQFISESAGYNNTLFTYDVDDQGNVSNIRQILSNSNQISTGESLGDVSLLNGQPNLLLLPNGADLVDDNSDLAIVDGKLQINGQTYTGDVYFSHSAEMSTDGKQHFQLSKDQNGHATVKIEDLRDLGDKDFNDLEIKVLTGNDGPVIAGLGIAERPNAASAYKLPGLLLET